MRKTLTALLGTALISTALTGCGNHEKKDTLSAPQTPRQPSQSQELPEVYWVEGDDGYSTKTQSHEFIGIKSRGNIANLSKLEKGKDYGHNIETGEIVEISGQKYRITNLSRSENPFNQEPEEPGEPEYTTNQKVDIIFEEIPKIYEEMQKINEKIEKYHPSSSSQPTHKYQKPDCSKMQNTRDSIDIMDLPPVHHHKK